MPRGKCNCNKGARRQIRIRRSGDGNGEGGDLRRSNQLLHCIDGVSAMLRRGFSYSTEKAHQTQPRLLPCHMPLPPSQTDAGLRCSLPLVSQLSRATYNCMVTVKQWLGLFLIHCQNNHLGPFRWWSKAVSLCMSGSNKALRLASFCSSFSCPVLLHVCRLLGNKVPWK